MATTSQYKRLVCMACLLAVGFCGLAYRLFDLQILRHEELSRQARNNTQHTFVRVPGRGQIRDIRGNLLAASKEVKTVCADPSIIGTNEERVAEAIAPMLRMDAAQIAEKLRQRFRISDDGKTNPIKFVVLKRKVDDEDWEALRDNMLKLKFGADEKSFLRRDQTAHDWIRKQAIFTQPDQLRVYPNQSLAAHVLGYVGMKEEISGQGEFVEMVGKDGIEKTFDSVLTGLKGWRQTETDKHQRELVAYREHDVAPRDGLNVVLTLDAGIQHIVETELAAGVARHNPVSASSIVMRPKTGEILAMANIPAFDPNSPGVGEPEAMRNRAVTDLAEPGSTFKIVVVSGALNEQIITLDDSFDCEHGQFHFAGRTLHDAHTGYGVLTVQNIIAKSSNIGAAKIGIKMGEPILYQYILNYGFGHPTGIPLLGEACGIVHPLKKWSKVSISRVPMGQEIAVSPLQMIMAMGAIANHGVLMKPMLVDHLEDADGKVAIRYQPQTIRRVISEATAKQMVVALKSVVSTNGTAVQAKLAYYTVAGKTGTAQKAGHGVYLPGKYFSSFIGFFPADNPELCISVVFDEPQHGHFGGDIAGPVFQQIAERAANYLAIPPELTRPETSMNERIPSQPMTKVFD